jgi:hypothetical protein
MAHGGGLYANIHAKQERIKHGSGEHMRKPGSEGAPTAEAFKESAKTAKMALGGPVKHVEQKDTHCEHCGQKMMAHGGMMHETEQEASHIGHPHSGVAKLAKGGMAHCAHGGPAHCNAGCYSEGGEVHETEKEASHIGHPHSGVAKLAEGGTVQNEKLHPSHQAPKDPQLVHQTAVMRMGQSQSEVWKACSWWLCN